MKITREAFPVGRIAILTNGVLLSSMREDFWNACKKYNVTIRHTCYPIKLDNAGLKKIADGKLYPCPRVAQAPHLKKYFNLDLHISKKDGIDIYSVKSGEELLEKIARPIPFCRYCDVTDEPITCDWGLSRKDRYEWLAFGFTEDDIRYLRSKTPVVYVFGAGMWGTQTVTLLKNEGIEIKSVLVTRKKQGADNILGAPVVRLDELREIEPNSLCLVALRSPTHKAEVYPLLSRAGFGDVVPVFGIEE